MLQKLNRANRATIEFVSLLLFLKGKPQFKHRTLTEGGRSVQLTSLFQLVKINCFLN